MVRKSGLHQLRWVLYAIIYQVNIPGAFLAGLLNHQQYVIISFKMALLAKSYHFTNLDFPQDSRGPISQPPNAVSNYIISIVRQKKSINYMDVSENSTPRSSILGYRYFWKHLYGWSWNHPYCSWEDTFLKAELRRLAPSKNDS